MIDFHELGENKTEFQRVLAAG